MYRRFKDYKVSASQEDDVFFGNIYLTKVQTQSAMIGKTRPENVNLFRLKTR